MDYETASDGGDLGLVWAGDGEIGRDDSQKVDLILEKALEQSRYVR